jgi:SET and MYND domain-containing protein
MIPILNKLGLTPSCHPLLALTRLHQSLLVASISVDTGQDVLDDTIRTAGRALAGLTAILHPGHPVRGVAKLLAMDEPNPSSRPAASTAFPPSGPQRLKLAYETAIKARNELLIGFGACNEGGHVGREIRDMIVALENELGIWGQGVRQAIEEMPKTKPI